MAKTEFALKTRERTASIPLKPWFGFHQSEVREKHTVLSL